MRVCRTICRSSRIAASEKLACGTPDCLARHCLPVRRSAFRHTPDRAKCADELGIDPKRRTVLLMGGGAGLGRLDEVAARLLQLEHDFQLIALAGRNTEVLLALQRLAIRHPGRLLPHGYTNRIECLMACADLVVTKPGCLTVAECLATGLPMIVNSPIPGQEERNADYLLEQGVALKANDPVTLEYRLLDRRGFSLVRPQSRIRPGAFYCR